MATEFKVVIPSRYDSTRLPGKPLRLIRGKPMIQWVAEAGAQSGADEVIVATDDDRIAEAVKGFGGIACMTSRDHENGTDRIVEVAEKMNWSDDTVIVNLQGDEPLMPAQNLTQVAENLTASDCQMATLFKLVDHEAAQNPNQVKLVCDQDGRALYFSRSPIPFERNPMADHYLGHIGLYAYRVGFLQTYAGLAPCTLEQTESLEQLRALYYGYAIHAALAQAMPGPGVDTIEDLMAVDSLLGSAEGGR